MFLCQNVFLKNDESQNFSMNILLGKTQIVIFGSLDEFNMTAETIFKIGKNSQNCLTINTEIIENCIPYKESLCGIEFILSEESLSFKITNERRLQLSGNDHDLKMYGAAFLFDEHSTSGNHHHLEQLVFANENSEKSIDILIEIE